MLVSVFVERSATCRDPPKTTGEGLAEKRAKKRERRIFFPDRGRMMGLEPTTLRTTI